MKDDLPKPPRSDIVFLLVVFPYGVLFVLLVHLLFWFAGYRRTEGSFPIPTTVGGLVAIGVGLLLERRLSRPSRTLAMMAMVGWLLCLVLLWAARSHYLPPM